MPTGRVRWFDAAKGYGFITSEEGKDVFLPAQALPTGVTTLRRGAKVEYSVAPSPLPICCRQQKAGHVAACGGGSIRCTGLI